VLDGTEPPPSLKNIYKELHDDLGCPIPDTGCLDKWARQGVLLLNTALSVRAGAANSHSGKGWETLTDSVIVKLSAQNKPLVFILWGGNARKKKAFIDAGRHLVLESAHPSPLSCAGFFGCRHFSKANAFLERNGQAPINWVL
jgi:uracil-DNA glycosylase